MTQQVQPAPEGYHTITPALIVRGADEAIDFYRRAFGAEVVMRMPGPGGQGVMHAELTLGDSRVMLCDEWPDMGCRSPQALGGTPVSLHLYVADVDAAVARAVAAGAEVTMPPADMFWGDRFAKVVDPFGHAWSLGTHQEDVSPEEIRRRADACFAQMARPQCQEAAAV
jgi:PhnB protein